MTLLIFVFRDFIIYATDAPSCQRGRIAMNSRSIRMELLILKSLSHSENGETFCYYSPSLSLLGGDNKGKEKLEAERFRNSTQPRFCRKKGSGRTVEG